MKKLLIVVGAGASIEFGMPSVRTIDNWFDEWGKQAMPLVADPNESLYGWIKRQVKEYSAHNPNNWPDKTNNFENLLYTIQLLGELERDRRSGYNNRLNPFISIDLFPQVKGFSGVKDADGDDCRHLHVPAKKIVSHLLTPANR